MKWIEKWMSMLSAIVLVCVMVAGCRNTPQAHGDAADGVRRFFYNEREYRDTGETAVSRPDDEAGVFEIGEEHEANFPEAATAAMGSRWNRLLVRYEGEDTHHVFACNENDLDGVSIEVLSAEPEAGEFLLSSESVFVIAYGDGYLLERKTGEHSWEAIDAAPEAIVRDDVLTEMAHNESVNLVIEWSVVYGVLPAGTYRLVKQFLRKKPDGTGEEHFLTAEFTIA